MTTGVSNDLLRRDVRMLGDMLGCVISELAGPDSLARVEEIRRLARDRRAGDVDAERKLSVLISELDERQARIVTRAFTVFFDMANLAEDRHRVRVLRNREAEQYPEPISESIPAAIAQFKKLGLTAAQVQAALDKVQIELVFTAHPSEAKRRSIRAKLRRMRQTLQDLDSTDLLQRERERLQTSLRADLMVLWQTAFLRAQRPTVMEEVQRGLSIMPRLWEVVPQAFAALRRALHTYYPGETIQTPLFVRFGSWMGGDRDGNPNVTSDVSENTLLWLREAAITHHLTFSKKAFDLLSLSIRETAVTPELEQAITAALERWPEVAKSIEGISPREIYRRWIGVIQWRLNQSRLPTLGSPLVAGSYRDGCALAADLELLRASLATHHGELLLESDLQAWLDLTRVFGLHLTRLDIRQDARRYQEIVTEVFATTNLASNFAALPESEQKALLVKTMGFDRPIDVSKLSPLSADTMRLFRILQQALATLGPDCIGAHITSLTRNACDVLCVLWLWRWAQAMAKRETGAELPAGVELRIAPLFEKIGDLARGAHTLCDILDEPCYAEHLKRQGNRQIVMVGYSDSTKDGGYLAACWGLYRAQSQLQAVAAERSISLTFFHGRGGSLGRGGGPAARGILSLPPEALDGTLRLTEQGEVLAERYDDVQVAYRHIEQVTWATLTASNVAAAEVKPSWFELMESLSQRSLQVYRELVDQPGFINFFAETTPIDEIENLPIGSRPARRRGERTLDDLRAIPWVFSWTQNRCMIPAWYGLGTALTEVKYRDRAAWLAICEMYRQWPFMQATIDNAALALAKVDMYIGQHYSELCESPETRERLWMMIASERDRTRQGILDIVGGEELLATVPWFRGSIEVRNPYIDPLNLIQIDLIRRRRKVEGEQQRADEHERLRDLLRLTVQGIAAGMRTTG
ncbi:MAG: phosphoenolpyruvate carboxylase [Planctomycetes bacterium]|nr:phosphoenolpyruvate carboxylase [Planctomycetota bacterium]